MLREQSATAYSVKRARQSPCILPVPHHQPAFL
jgi:hypothetical protein